MADQKLTELAAVTTPTTDDIVYVVDDPGGVPVGKKITLANLTKVVFNDAEGDPAAVGTAADGTSTYAARRDHVHAAGNATDVLMVQVFS